MSSYEELYVAQVRTKARAFAHVYSKLQQLIKERTKAGYIHGYYQEDCIPGGDYIWGTAIEHNSDTIKVSVKTTPYPPKGNRMLQIHFVTKR